MTDGRLSDTSELMSADAPNPPEPRSLRERKRAAAKAAVAEVAIRLFAERGYGEVSVAEICAEAEVAPRSFFRYFPAKEDVLLEPVRELADRFQAAIAAAPPELDDREALLLGLRTLAAHMLDNWERLADYFRVIQQTNALRASPLVQLADRERALAEQLQRRRGDPSPPDWRTRLLVARSVAAYRVWLDELRSTDVPDPLPHLERLLAEP